MCAFTSILQSMIQQSTSASLSTTHLKSWDLHGPMQACVFETDAVPKKQFLDVCEGACITEARASDGNTGRPTEAESQALDSRHTVFVKEAVAYKVLLGVTVGEILTEAEIQGRLVVHSDVV